ncbi:uncharacterized protein Triagg1_9058 [Trichoderma aggressivum f. europaeum]|uniref:Uncharacterized protein n=1 Tax=Trichoderma aggressivum f. europaeum TaxID=173218 RepID=A0AAE1M165_9HYPO|nr:hypothetical protein Triagg1_9058 [Trichoderma aggressivum f. europaeum]
MPNLFCCSSVRPYRPRRLDHERKFDNFMQWAKSTSAEPNDGSSLLGNADYVIQLVRQANYGRKESVRYFTTANEGTEFAEVGESDLIAANFEKLNSYVDQCMPHYIYKNFKCVAHDKFFEVNLYQQNPTNTHHWRANIARPATDIDLVYRQKKEGERSAQAVKAEDTKQEDLDTDAVSQLDIPALKSVLGFLLPKVKTNLGSNPLVSLLALDWANQELNLGLEIEDLWISELNTSNIATFLSSYVKLSAGDLTTSKAAKIDHEVGYAIGCGNLLAKGKTLGRSKLQEIVENVLNFHSASDWVSKCREGILRMFTAAPDERLLELGQRKEDEYQDRHIKVTSKVDCEEGDNDDYNQYDYSDEYEYNNTNDYNASSSDFDKDFTACDKECGYCGRCSY